MKMYEANASAGTGRMANDGADTSDSGHSELVERARQGDTEAFGELVEQHRGRARAWAQRLTGDPHLADDIVQDALIRAFLHVGTLTDTSRFLPWLHRIVRNQAHMRLRRGGPYKRERPFASFGAGGAAGSSRDSMRAPTPGNPDAVHWDDLDGILYHLTRSASQAIAKEQDPAEQLMRKELYETIHALLHCLTRKERNIFEAYFFRQLAPEEIADMYRMTTGSIYTYIHRSRRKLRQEHIRVSLGLLPEKGERRLTSRRSVLELPEWPAHGKLRFTFIDRIGHMLAAVGDRAEPAELMGVSGFAFRMQVSAKTTYADGIYMFDWRSELRALMETLGYGVTQLCGQLAGSPAPLVGAVERFPVVLPIEEAVLPFIRKYVDLGKPVLYFDTTAAKPFVHEWALIYGYDDEQRLVYVTDWMRPEGKTLSYDDVTDNPVRYLAGIDGKLAPQPAQAAQKAPTEQNGSTARTVQPIPTAPETQINSAGKSRAAEMPCPGDKLPEALMRAERQALAALRKAAELARHGGGYRPMTVYVSYSYGLAAYDCWLGHLRRGPEAPPNRYGMGQLAAVYAETKRMAAQYLRGLPLQGETMRLTLLASEAYEQASEALQELSALVPFVRGASMLTPEETETCAALLERAKTFEAAAIEYMELAYGEPAEETGE